MLFYIFPFDKIEKDQLIVIWGYGECGREYVRQLEALGYCTVKYVVDSNYEKFDETNIVKSPAYLKEDIAARNYPVVVAINDKTQACIVADLLMNWGWKEDNIVLGNVKLWKKNITRSVINISNGIFEFCEQLHKNLRIMRPCCEKKMVRIGNKNDGGYLMLNDFNRGSIAYSFGIGRDIGWEMEVSKMGYDVYMYDHTIDCCPSGGENRSLHFFKKGISNQDNINVYLDTLSNFIKLNHHENKTNMILKMDVEGAERDALIDACDAQPSVMDRFYQIVIEVHDLHDKKCWKKILEMFKKIQKTHRLIHIHGNNASRYLYLEGDCLPNCIEVTYLNKKLYDFSDFNGVLPLDIDAPNLIDYDDVLLGKWNIK